LSTQ
jgi:hypothetical protein